MASLFVQTTICIVSARLAWWQQKQSMVIKLTEQQQIVLGAGWGIESKHVFNRESFFRIVITKAGTVATTVFFNTQIDLPRGR